MFIKNIPSLFSSTRRLCYNFGRVRVKNNLTQRLQVTYGTVLKDYEYCKLISDDIKFGDVNSAYYLVLQSYFNNVTLDMEIFNKLFEVLQTQAKDISYSIVLYKIYKQTFKPNIFLCHTLSQLSKLYPGMEQQIKNDIAQTTQKLMNSIKTNHNPGRRAASAKDMAKQKEKENGIHLKKVVIQYDEESSQKKRFMSPKELLQTIKEGMPTSVLIGQLNIKKNK